ncbi:hypothetical protein A8D86_19645 [Burkholderia cenocepacia]|nr:hypothetical protein A8D83_12050 [Burkholderia cenocepacia]ONP39936.1 hypothetical protein A8D86_19645 [Burkholderia cenocepacia]ONQ00955.1 hypothetical protein A8D97_34775 [Burkholderia cenocepacia]ONQ24171.1 hypothetical protein A8D98_31340 [Burkholderia cenocepacia]ONQ57990.1 hypothetical protein A8E01_21840 [Burkholderia cenocepacia]
MLFAALVASFGGGQKSGGWPRTDSAVFAHSMPIPMPPILLRRVKLVWSVFLKVPTVMSAWLQTDERSSAAPTASRLAIMTCGLCS